MNTSTKIYLVDSPDSHANLLPLSFTRPVADFRVGITTIREKWEHFIPGNYNYYPVEYLREKFGDISDHNENALFISGSLIPDQNIADAINMLRPGEVLFKGETPLAYNATLANIINKEYKTLEFPGEPRIIKYVFDIFRLNPTLITEDFHRLTSGRNSQPLSDSNRVIGDFTDEEGRPHRRGCHN